MGPGTTHRNMKIAVWHNLSSGGAKRALQLWCRRAAPTPDWAGAGITLNVVALGFFDTPAAAYVLGHPEARAA